MGNAVSILLIGIGGYGNLYSGALLDNMNNDKYYIKGIVDPKPENSKHYERIIKLEIPIFSKIEEFYEKRTADLAIISSPIHFHATQSIYALSKGSNVLCEKPICATKQDAEKMIEAKNKSGKFLAIGYQWSYCSAMLNLKRDILSGKFGRAQRLKTLVLWPRDEMYYSRGWAGKLTDGKGNLVYDSVANNATAHYLHNMFFILGNRLDKATSLKSVQAELYRANKIENFDTTATKIITEDGVEILFIAAHPTASIVGPCFEYQFEKGKIYYELSPDISKNTIKAIMNDGTEIDYGNPSVTEAEKLWVAINAVNNNAVITCFAETALPHISCINAMQESVPSIKEFPVDLVKTKGTPAVTFVEGLDKILLDCYHTWKLPSECGIPWASVGKTINT